MLSNQGTLSFASCAKEVATNAQVNVVMSDKALLKHLQRELARLENELKGSASTSVTCDSVALLNEKELLIEKMDKEIKELIQQRDLAQSRVEDLLRSVGEDQVSRLLAESDDLLQPQEQNARKDEYSALESSDVADTCHLDVDLRALNTPQNSDRRNGLNSNNEYLQQPENSENHFLYDGTSPQLSISTPEFVGPDPCQGWEERSQITDVDSEDICKDVRCIEMEESSMNIKTKSDAFSPGPGEKNGKLAFKVFETEDKMSLTQNGDSHIPTDYAYGALKQKIRDMQKTIKCLVNIYPLEQSPSHEGDMSSSRSLNLTKSRSCRAVLMNIPSSSWVDKSEQDENTPPNGFEKDFRPKLSELKFSVDIGKLSRKDSQTPSASMDEKAQNIKKSAEEDITSAHNVVAGVNEMAEVKSENHIGDDSVMETEPTTDKLGTIVNEAGLGMVQGALESPTNWPLDFEMQRRKIIELWHACNVPLVHRTYFFLLFKGDPSDSVYMEVEIRRLSFLKDSFSRGTNTVKDGRSPTMASSMRALNREREMLSKQMLKRLSEKERDCIYQKWGIGLDTKYRKLQLARRLWTNTKDMDHINESAALVAKLVGVAEPSETPKEMFELSFSPRPVHQRSQSWKSNMSSLL